MQFQSTILTLPGIGGSGPEHWQSLWENEYGFARLEQREWETPVRADWVTNIDKQVSKYNPQAVILVGHSAVCAAILYWVQQYQIKVKGALLVAPADPEAKTFPSGATGFAPMPLIKLSFPSIVVASSNDYFATLESSKHFADAWGSEFINIGEAGHINVASGYGEWDKGLEILKQLDK
jgi:predicted alpha/beta hydrolase family esterase